MVVRRGGRKRGRGGGGWRRREKKKTKLRKREGKIMKHDVVEEGEGGIRNNTTLGARRRED